MQEALNLDQMELSQKFLLLEEIWENLSQNVSNEAFSPQWHLDELDRRVKNSQNGTAEFSDLSEVKHRLKK